MGSKLKRCVICGTLLFNAWEYCLDCKDDKEYWDMVDKLAMTKQDGATLHLKPHRTRGRSRF